MLRDCYAHFECETGRLSIGNCAVEKTVIVTGGCVCTESVADKTGGRVWRGETLMKQRCPVIYEGEQPVPCVDVAAVEDDLLMKPHLKATVALEGRGGRVWYEYVVFPGIPFVYTQAFVEKTGGEAAATVGEDIHAVTGIENAAQRDMPGDVCSEDTLECIPLGASHLEVENVILCDKTDRNDSLVERQTVPVYARGMAEREGNIFRITDIVTRDSLMLVKHAPTISSALNRRGKDLVLTGNRYAFLMGTGVDFNALPDEKIPYYASAVGVGKAEDIFDAFWQYSAAFSAGDRSGRLFIMSNTWGDRSQDMAVCEEFILREIERGHGLGVDIMQIDDGWQTGMTANSRRGKNGVWEGYYAYRDDFWTVNPERFPNGLEPLAEKARDYGMEIGLWFSPDSSNEFANWERDIETIWELHSRYGVRYFKLDGVKIRSKLCEKRFINIMKELTRHSGGEIRFNLDVTAEDRFGYLYEMQYGTLFVENRYTDWGNYYPHNTFKNLWSLAAVMPARRLQMELLNKNRNPHMYTGMRFAPAEYETDYLFATVMPANPLVWMEVSHLPDADAARLSGIIAEYRKYRCELFDAHVMPIGEMPNGMRFSGYFCRCEDGKAGHILLFRESTASAEYVFKLPCSIDGADVSVVYRSCAAETEVRGDTVAVNIAEERSFVWLRYEFE